MSEPVRVVVADDQALVRGAFRMLVDSAPDLQVVGEAENGAEAVGLVKQLVPDVTLMDIRMPVMDGLAATAAIAALGLPTRVLVLTTFDLDEYVFDALRAGASGFLLKDTPPANLLSGIRVIAAGEALLAPSVTRLAHRGVRQEATRRPTTAAAARRADRPRDRGPGSRRPRLVQPGDRRNALRQRRNRQDPCQPAADEARRPRPGAAHRRRLRKRPGHPAPAAGLTSSSAWLALALTPP